MSGWQNKDHIERLKALHADGKSASEIAMTINREFRDAGYSRNAVIGKSGRLGLGSIGGGRASNPTTASRVTIARTRPEMPGKPRLQMPRGSGVIIPPPIGGPTQASPHENGVNAAIANAQARLCSTIDRAQAFQPLPGSSPVAWTERPFGGCSWPVGGEGAETVSCSERTSGKTYCAEHARIAFAPVPTGKPRNGNELARSLRRYS